MTLHTIAQAYRYAAEKHADQRRLGTSAEPYVNHVIEVAARVSESPFADETLLIGALLHDIVEDTDGTRGEIAALFGEDVAALVMEVTDDKTLAKAERKRRQVESSPGKTAQAKRIKLADKASNISSMVESPPDWPLDRKRAYVEWAGQVVVGCRGVDPTLEAAFDAAEALARQALDC